MTELQRKILTLLKEIDSICKMNGIEYYLEGGSALGAVRSGGFLPWDDDADIAMTRDNWDKFAEAMKEKPFRNRKIESPEENIESPVMFMRYIDTSTTQLWRSYMFANYSRGIAIDIILLENAPDDDELLGKMVEDLIDYNELIHRYYRESRLADSKRYKQLIERSKIVGREKAADEINAKLLMYRDLVCKRYLMRWTQRIQIYDKEMFGRPKYVPFEDTMLPIPEQTTEYLTYQFGVEWFKVPKAQETVTHQAVLDMDVSYPSYVDSYIPLLNRESVVNFCQEYKDLQMEVLDYNRAYHRHIYGVAGGMAAATLEKKLAALELDLETAFSEVNEESEALFQQLFSDYLLKQLNQWYQYFGVYVPVDDDILSCVADFLIRLGELSKVEKLVELRLEQKKELKPSLKRTVETFSLLKHTLDLFWAGELSEAARLIDNIPGNQAKAPLQTAISLLNRMANADRPELEHLRAQSPELIAQFPGEDAFKLLYACVLYRLHYRVSAGKLLRKLVRESRNGMIVRMILTDSRLAPLTADAVAV